MGKLGTEVGNNIKYPPLTRWVWSPRECPNSRRTLPACPASARACLSRFGEEQQRIGRMDHEFIARNREIRGRSFDNSVELGLRSTLTSPIESSMESSVTTKRSGSQRDSS